VADIDGTQFPSLSSFDGKIEDLTEEHAIIMMGKIEDLTEEHAKDMGFVHWFDMGFDGGTCAPFIFSISFLKISTIVENDLHSFVVAIFVT